MLREYWPKPLVCQREHERVGLEGRLVTNFVQTYGVCPRSVPTSPTTQVGGCPQYTTRITQYTRCVTWTQYKTQYTPRITQYTSCIIWMQSKLYYRVAIQDCKSRECAQVPRWQDVNNATQFASVTKAGCRFWRFHAFWDFTLISNGRGCLLGLCVSKFLIELWDYLPSSLYVSALVYVQRGSGGARADVWMSSKDKHWFKSDQVQQRYTGHTWVTGLDW